MRARSLLIVCAGFLTCLIVSAAWLEDSDDADTKKIITRKKKPSVTNIVRETNLAAQEMKTPDTKSVVTSGSYVTLVAAERDKSGAKAVVTWVDVPTSGVTYKIYRSTTAISTITAFETARLVGTVGDNIGSYVDAPPPGTYYYAVTASLKGVEQRVLVIDQSYTSMGVKVTAAGPEDNGFVRNIKSFYEPNTRSIIVMWEPLAAAGNYTIYRSDAPIANEGALAKATSIDELEYHESVFVDRHIDLARAYYYAIMLNMNGNIVKQFLANHTYTTLSAEVKPRATVSVVVPQKTNAKKDDLFDIDIPPLTPKSNVVVMTKPEKTDPRVYTVTNIRAEMAPGIGIRISWELPQNVSNAFSFIVYRSKTTALSTPFALNNDLMHKIINPYEYLADNRRYVLVDMTVESATPYYYAVLVANGSPYLSHPFFPDVNYTTKPVTPVLVDTNAVRGPVSVVITNIITNTVVATITNLNAMTNLFAVTNYVDIPVTNVVTETVTNVIAVTNTVAMTNVFVQTNEARPDGTVKGTYEKLGTPDDTVRAILNTRYYPGRFAEAADALAAFLASDDSMPGDRSWYIAKLFLGRSHLELRQYRTALDVFQSVRQRSPEEVDFWIDKTITAMQRPYAQPKEKKL